ncbi:MAG: hypothetical protein RMZ43_002930 [Nostoc sp. CmiVER01]|uniref:hypothetical protein n=1 Tax=Nostoc sp. CmiVER01 TaxID=3075384 RepID=UPI002AD4AB91|nr:hypothetical protein [Nostoc sp. CmiVER01]MDZ8124757.1 hypothetical protein [Nostoc sp. CmiVER01]
MAITQYLDQPCNGWSYDDTKNLWLSRYTLQRQVSLNLGQTIIIGGVIGTVSSSSGNIPYPIGNLSNNYLLKASINFNTTGTLTSVNYWKLEIRDISNVLTSIDLIAGDSLEATGNITKTSGDLNIILLTTGKYFLSFVKVGNAPNAINPTVLIEYQLNKL